MKCTLFYFYTYDLLFSKQFLIVGFQNIEEIIDEILNEN